MIKKLLFFSIFLSIAHFGTCQLSFSVKNLPDGPITTNGVQFLHCRLLPFTSAPTTGSDVVFAISEQPTQTFANCGAMVRFKSDAANLGGDGINIDVRNGGTYASNPASLLSIQFNSDYFLYLLLDIPSGKYSVYGRSEKMTELYQIFVDASYRVPPVSSLGYSSILYTKDSTTVPTLRVKEFRAISPLKFATSININTTSNIGLNIPTQLSVTTVPADANTGVAWKVLKGDSYATIDGDGKITVLKDTVIDVEAYAVTLKGATQIKTLSQLRKTTGIDGNFGHFELVKLTPTISEDGNYNVQLPENMNQNLSYKVYSVFGQEIKSGTLEGKRMSIGTSKSGVYFVHFNNNLVNQSIQIIVK
jgi:hypothetical protein